MRASNYILLTTLLGFSTNLGASEYSACLEISSYLERLECYDTLARKERQRQSEAIESVESIAVELPQKPVESGQLESASQSVTVQAPDPVEREQAPLDTAQPRAKEKESRTKFFGKSEPKNVPRQVRARIDSIRKSPGGNRIMTLSNGQVWAENEPGRLQIQTEQLVTITKKRFNFEMKLESGKKVAVRRID